MWVCKKPRSKKSLQSRKKWQTTHEVKRKQRSRRLIARLGKRSSSYELGSKANLTRKESSWKDTITEKERAGHV